MEIIRSMLPEGFDVHAVTGRAQSDLEAAVADADYAVWWDLPVPEAVLAAGPRLKLLHKWGVGVDNLDLEAARACGIKVARTTGSNALPVAEFTLGLMIAALRNLSYGHAELKKGLWRGGRLPRDGFMLSGKTVGIVGFGAIGKTLARLLAGFGCRILYTKRAPLPAEEDASLGVAYASLPDLLAQADVVSLHCPLTPETAGLINRETLGLMKPTAVLVNVARGGVVVEPDLVWALRTGIIHAAASDVFETEPLPSDSPLLDLDNLVVTPHLAAGAADNFVPTVRHMFGNILRVSRGEPVPERDLVVG